LIIDIEADTLTVRGRGNAYWRTNEVKILANGETVSLTEIRGINSFTRTTRQQTASVETDQWSDLAKKVREFDPASYETLVSLIDAASGARDGYVDPTALIEGVLNVRRIARDQGHYDIADRLRDVLTGVDLEINDGPDGSSWTPVNAN
jgi:cysteinyl-tRNA synthetase